MAAAPRRPSRPPEFPYDARHTPPAPVLPLRCGPPRTEPATAVAALVDSGADITVLPEGVADALDLPQIGELTVRGIGGTRRVPVYAAEVEVTGWRRLVEVVAVGDEALLGRDVLNAWVVTLDGPRQALRVESR